jgi:hypothetical protein
MDSLITDAQPWLQSTKADVHAFYLGKRTNNLGSTDGLAAVWGEMEIASRYTNLRPVHTVRWRVSDHFLLLTRTEDGKSLSARLTGTACGQRGSIHSLPFLREKAQLDIAHIGAGVWGDLEGSQGAVLAVEVRG